MRVRCLVPECGGIIDATSPSTVPCPECAKRVQVMPRLQEQIRALQTQVLQLQASTLARSLPLLRAIGKKPATTKDLAATLKLTATGVGARLLKLEKRGLVGVGEFRRVNGRAVGVPVWKLSALGDRVVQEGAAGGGEMTRSEVHLPVERAA